MPATAALAAGAAGSAGANIASAALSPAIQGLFGLGGSALNYYFNKQLASQQNQYNIDMWKMQADYNSPQAQMQRFQEAGLNPNLIYGQGNSGNMSSAPQMVTPQAPDVSKAMQKIGEAFNIENLRTIIANRKKAEAEAKNERINADRNEAEYQGDIVLAYDYSYDPKSGEFVFTGTNGDPNTRNTTIVGASNFYKNRRIADYHRNSLIPLRGSLLSSQRAYLDPQIWMAEYDKRFYPTTFWVGTVGKGAKAVSDVTSIFNPSRYLMPIGSQTRGFITPSGRILNY